MFIFVMAEWRLECVCVRVLHTNKKNNKKNQSGESFLKTILRRLKNSMQFHDFCIAFMRACEHSYVNVFMREKKEKKNHSPVQNRKKEH